MQHGTYPGGRTRTVTAVVLVLLCSAALLGPEVPAHAQLHDGGLCDNSDPARLSNTGNLPVRACVNSADNHITIENTASYWVRLSVPGGAEIDGSYNLGAKAEDQIIAGVVPDTHMPPGGRTTILMHPSSSDRLRIGVEILTQYTIASYFVSLIPSGNAGIKVAMALELVSAVTSFVQCRRDAGGNFIENVKCTVRLDWDIRFAVGRFVLDSGVNLPLLYGLALDLTKANTELFITIIDAVSRYNNAFTAVPPPKPASPTPTSPSSEPVVVPVSPSACSPPVPSGSRGVADTTRFAGDPCSGVYVRSGAELDATIHGTLVQGTVFDIHCQVRGQVITDASGYASDVWNRVDVQGVQGFVQDTWSGRKGWLDLPCGPGGAPVGGCNPAIPPGNQGVADSTRWTPDPCSGAYLRTGPGNWDTITREIPQGHVFPISCQVRGQAISDSNGFTSDVWNRTTFDGLTGWVADTFSGRKGWLDIPCGAPTGCNPPVPDGNRGVSDTTRFAGDRCSGVNLRDGTQLSNRVLTEIPQGTVFEIHCQQRGEPIYDETGYTSDIWNRTTYNGHTGWVQDTWSGRKGWLELSCDAQPPSAPADVTTAPGDGQLSISWGVPSGNGGRVLSYELEVLGPDRNVLQRLTSSEPQAIAAGLTNGVAHTVQIRALNHKGPGGWSAPTVPATPVGVPWQAGIPSLGTDDAALDVRWSWASQADNGDELLGFDLEITDGTATTALDLAADQEGALLRAVEAGTSYRARVRAVGRTGAGDWSTWSDPQALPAGPASVSDGTTQLAADRLRVSWQPVAGAQRYELVSDAAGAVITVEGTSTELIGVEARASRVAVRPIALDGTPGDHVVLSTLATGTRVDGGGRVDPVGQSVATSRSLFADGSAERVVLATADRFPDALAGAALAGSRGPILMTPTDQPLDPRVEEEIRRVTGGDGHVLVLGGTAAVSEPVARAARSAAGDRPCAAPLPGGCRYAGTGREHTAALVAGTVLAENPGTAVLVARSDDYADSITGGAYAAYAGIPVLLTPTTAADRWAAERITTSRITDVIVLGGTSAVAGTTAQELGVTRRVAGDDRVATSVAIATQLWGGGGQSVGGGILVNVRDASGWQTALAAASAAAIHGLPQLGVEPPSVGLSETVREHLQTSGGVVTAYGDATLVDGQQLDAAVDAAGT